MRFAKSLLSVLHSGQVVFNLMAVHVFRLHVPVSFVATVEDSISRYRLAGIPWHGFSRSM